MGVYRVESYIGAIWGYLGFKVIWGLYEGI